MVDLRVDVSRDMSQLCNSIHRDMILLHERVAIIATKQHE